MDVHTNHWEIDTMTQQLYTESRAAGLICSQRGLDDMLRAAAARRFIAQHSIAMLQFAVYDESAGRYVLGLGA